MPIETNIFYVDDDADDQLLFQEAFQEITPSLDFNVNLYHAQDGIDFFNLLHKTRVIPDITFLDINMPKKNGFECLSEMKSSEKYRDKPVVMISTSESRELISKAHQLGADKYIVKPVDFSELKEAIKKCIDEYKATA